MLDSWDDSKEPVWTPWNRSLGEEETVHKYLNDNFMARFIPKRFTWNKDHPEYEQPAWFKRAKNKENNSYNWNLNSFKKKKEASVI